MIRAVCFSEIEQAILDKLSTEDRRVIIKAFEWFMARGNEMGLSGLSLSRFAPRHFTNISLQFDDLKDNN